MSIGLGAASSNIDTALKREREKELIFIGKQYQQALTSYQNQSSNVLPTQLSQLLTDNRALKPVHHLRKPFLDPMTHQAWGLVRNPQNQIIAVYSRSNEPFITSREVLTKKVGDDIPKVIIKHSDLIFKYQSNQNDQTASQPSNEQQLSPTPF